MSEKAYFQSIKTSLKSVTTNAVVIQKLTDAALLTSRIMTHTLQLMKLYMIKLYDNGQPLPKVDRPFVTAVMKTLCDTPTTGRPPSVSTVQMKAELAEFCTEHYSPFMEDTLNYRYLNTVLDYMSTEIETMYEKNIKQRFCTNVERFVNVSLHKKAQLEAIKQSDETE